MMSELRNDEAHAEAFQAGGSQGCDFGVLEGTGG
jgi:hypothetical protein